MPDKISEFLNRAVQNIYPSKEALETVLRSGKKLKIYNGIDPTGPTLHIGHGVVLMKLRELQDLGHKIILLIGDYTALIGDPTDKDKTRPVLTHQQIMDNSALFKTQASHFLRFDGDNPAELKYNGEWLGKLTFEETIKLASNFTVQQMIERDMFEKRIKEKRPIFIHEFLYPLMQGYDSVAMDVDMEIGGNDQTFNMLSGRTLMKQIKNKEKFVLATKLLVDPTGKKMGKSEGNMVMFTDSPEDMFGKVMSWPDERILLGFELCTNILLNNVSERISKDPMMAKKDLAEKITANYYGEEKAKDAKIFFEEAHQKRKIPEKAREIKQEGEGSLVEFVIANNLTSSKTEWRRLVVEGAVKINGIKIKKPDEKIKNGDSLQIGKHQFVRII